MPDTTFDVRLEARGDGIVLDVLVAPRASKTRIIGVHNGALKIATTAPPVDGEANESIRRYLAQTLQTAKGNVALVRGQSSRHKRFAVAGVTIELARAFIVTALQGE